MQYPHIDLSSYLQLQRTSLQPATLLAVLPHGHAHDIPALPDGCTAAIQLGREPHFSPEGATFFPLPKTPLMPLHPMWQTFHSVGHFSRPPPDHSWCSLHAALTDRAQLAMNALTALDKTLQGYECVCLQPDTTTLTSSSGYYFAYWLHTPSQSLVSIKLDLLAFDVPAAVSLRQPHCEPTPETKELSCLRFLSEVLPSFCSQLQRLQLLSTSC